MSTSLSRQLQQLRASAPASTLTSASAAASSDLFSQGPFLIDGHEELDLNSLRQHARAAFNRLAESGDAGHAALDDRMRRRLQLDEFGDDEDAMDEDEDDDGPSWQADLLLLLSPSSLSAPTQMLLQWLVTRHRVHESHGEELLAALLPYYEYRVFARAVDAVAGGKMNRKDAGAGGDRCRGPGWLAAFREACHPATTIGLRRHLAADRGFFALVCQWAVKVHRHMVRFGQLRVGAYGVRIEQKLKPKSTLPIIFHLEFNCFL